MLYLSINSKNTLIIHPLTWASKSFLASDSSNPQVANTDVQLLQIIWQTPRLTLTTDHVDIINLQNFGKNIFKII